MRRRRTPGLRWVFLRALERPNRGSYPFSIETFFWAVV